MCKQTRLAAFAVLIPLAIAAASAPLALALPPLLPKGEVRAICKQAKPRTEACRSGRNEHTRGGPGTGKVSHADWPHFNGVLWRVKGSSRGKHDFWAGRAHDKLMGHHGSDTMYGQGQSDVLWGDYDATGNTRKQTDRLYGGDGDDFLYASHGRNYMTGGPGNDYLQAYYGRGVLDCGPGNDTVRVRRNSENYKLRGCEVVKHPCKHGNDGNGRCLKSRSSAAVRARG